MIQPLEPQEKPYTFSIIIPVFHEADSIKNVLESLTKLTDDNPYEIIIVDGSRQTDTIQTISGNDVHVLASKQGRASQMNKGAEYSCGDTLIFLHADTLLAPNALRQIKNVLREPSYVGGAFNVNINSPKLRFKLMSRMISLRSRVTRVPFGDQAIFIRRKYFMNIGGYKEIPLMEDVELMRRIRKRGDFIYIIPDVVRTSPRRWEKEGILYCTFRNWVIRTLYTCGVKPDHLVRFYHETEKEAI